MRVSVSVCLYIDSFGCHRSCVYLFIFVFRLIQCNWIANVVNVPFVCDVTGAHAALLLTAAIWLKIFAWICDWVTDGLRNDRNKWRDNSSGASQSRNASRKRRNPSKSISCRWYERREQNEKRNIRQMILLFHCFWHHFMHRRQYLWCVLLWLLARYVRHYYLLSSPQLPHPIVDGFSARLQFCIFTLSISIWYIFVVKENMTSELITRLHT